MPIAHGQKTYHGIW